MIWECIYYERISTVRLGFVSIPSHKYDFLCDDTIYHLLSFYMFSNVFTKKRYFLFVYLSTHLSIYMYVCYFYVYVWPRPRTWSAGEGEEGPDGGGRVSVSHKEDGGAIRGHAGKLRTDRSVRAPKSDFHVYDLTVTKAHNNHYLNFVFDSSFLYNNSEARRGNFHVECTCVKPLQVYTIVWAPQ